VEYRLSSFDELSRSGELSRDIYQQLRPAGLASRTTSEWDDRTVRRVQHLLESSVAAPQILDAGCGYGRIAIPLLQLGFDVIGIDVSPAMLDEANRLAAAAELIFSTLEGDICRLPYDDEAFDVVLCMWLTFNELLHESDQLATLLEFRRVLRPGGWALLDGPPYMEDSGDVDEVDMARYQSHLTDNTFTNTFTPIPCDECSVGRRYSGLMGKAGIERFQLLVDNCPGRLRYFLQFWVPSTSEKHAP
jgi:SAM-dependent methyltransferase